MPSPKNGLAILDSKRLTQGNYLYILNIMAILPAQSRLVWSPNTMLPIDIILDHTSICNLTTERDMLNKAIENGEHIVIFGRRNTGKTSLVKGVCVPEFLAKSKKSVAIEADFLGVDSIEEVQTRLRIALERGISRSFPKKQAAIKLVSTLAKLRPRLELEAMTGNIEFKFATDDQSSDSLRLEHYFDEIARLATQYDMLLVMDEFQDLDFIKGAVARIRTCLQGISSKLPIIVLGSKKHLLAHIFAAYRAPMANWGKDLEISPVISQSYQDEYFRYASRYFAAANLALDKEQFTELCQRTQGIPESINIVLNHCLSKGKSLSPKDLTTDTAIHLTLLDKSSRFEEILSRFSPNERQLLAAIAKFQPIAQLKAKTFLAHIRGMAPTSITTAAKKLEDKAEIYKEKLGYVIGDPLLVEYLKSTR